MINYEVLANYIDNPPTSCRICQFYIITSKFCLIERLHMNDIHNGCNSEYFLKMLLEDL